MSDLAKCWGLIWVDFEKVLARLPNAKPYKHHPPSLPRPPPVHLGPYHPVNKMTWVILQDDQPVNRLSSLGVSLGCIPD